MRGLEPSFASFVKRIQGGDEVVCRPQLYSIEIIEASEVDFWAVSVPRSLNVSKLHVSNLVMVLSRSAKVRLLNVRAPRPRFRGVFPDSLPEGKLLRLLGR